MNFHLLFLSCACVVVTSSTDWCPCLDSCSSTGSLTHHCFCTISTIVSTVKETSNCLILFWNIVLIWKTPWKGLESPALGSMDPRTTVIRNHCYKEHCATDINRCTFPLQRMFHALYVFKICMQCGFFSSCSIIFLH